MYFPPPSFQMRQIPDIFFNTKLRASTEIKFDGSGGDSVEHPGSRRRGVRLLDALQLLINDAYNKKRVPCSFL